MTPADLETIVVVSFLALLLGLEWRYRRRPLRVGATLLALMLLAWYQPNFTGARRRAIAMPPAERIRSSAVAGSEHDTLSEYRSGVYTTMREVGEAAGSGEGIRLAAVGALVWLAWTPKSRRVT